MASLFAKIHKVVSSHSILTFTCSYFVAPAGDVIFAILGSDRILYTPIDSNIGKEYAVRVVKRTAWNVAKVKVVKHGRYARYTIPKQFAKQLEISRGDSLLILGLDEGIHAIPVKYLLEKVGKFREPVLQGY